MAILNQRSTFSDHRYESNLRDALLSGEKLLWITAPKRGVRFSGKDRFLIPFGLFWLGFSLFWTFMAGILGGQAFGLFGIPFVLIGVYLVFGRFFVNAGLRKRTAYAITDKRVLMKSGWSGTISSYEIDDLDDVSFDMSKDGSGTIYLGPRSVSIRSSSYGKTTYSQTAQPPALDLIPDVKKVYELLVTIREKLKTATSS